MSELTTLARPYAVAIYERARETGTIDQWADELAFLVTVLEDERIAKAAANPKVKREEFTAAFLELCRDRLAPEAANLVRLLIQNRRLGLIKPIAVLFGQYRAASEGYVEAEVITAFPLEDHERDGLGAALERILQKQTRLRVSIDSRLIAGVYIRAGDRVIDASLRGQIERLAKRLLN